MASFIQLIAKDLITKYQYNLKDLTVVFPNKRAGLFLADALSELVKKPTWMPEIFTFHEFIEQQTGIKKAENITLTIKLYKAYLQASGTNEKFEDFYFWGNLLLEDFDDIDKYLIDPKTLFSNIVSLKELESGFSYLTPEQITVIQNFWNSFNPEKYSKEQEEFLKIWNNLYSTYTRFKKQLTAEGICYEGMGERHFYEHIEEYSREQPIVFAGFNALSPCEKQIFTFYHLNRKAHFYWDYDIYYSTEEYHEAGRYIRENLKLFPNELGQEQFNNFKYNRKQIEYISVPSSIGQAKLIPKLLEDLPEKDNIQTALVLCDERLLIPVMHSIPEDIRKINITMGYPARNTSAAALIYMLGELKNYTKTAGGETYYYYKPVIALLNHKLLRNCCPEDIDKTLGNIRQKNIIYIPAQSLYFNAVTQAIFEGKEEKIPDYLLRILKLLTQTFDIEKEKSYAIEKEFIFTLYLCIQNLKNTFEEEQIEPESKLYLQIIYKVLGSVSIPFSGEPLEGLQIMGLLETRMLDFKNLIIFSANEGILPKTNIPSSFIPYNLRVGFRLPTPEQREALFAYNFYRLLQRAQNVKILYTSVIQNLNGGEMSRYLHQIKYESGLTVKEQNFQNRISLEEEKEIHIPKNESILRGLERYMLSEETALSPSALNTYIDCPLKFYFKYIAGIKEKEEMAEELDHRLLGNIFHESVQSLYATVGGQEITSRIIDSLLSNQSLLEEHVYRSYLHVYNQQTSKLMDSGSNELILEIIKKYIRQMFQYDKTLCPFRIISTEKKYCIPVPVQTPAGTQPVFIGGIIDRVDQIGDTIRVIDYKTGADNTQCKNISSVFDSSNPQRNKAAFQTMLYCLMFKQHCPPTSAIIPGIYSIKLLFGNDYNYKLKCDNTYITDFNTYREEFYQLLTALLSRLFSPEQSFTQAPSEKKCRTCQYSGICRK